MGRELRPGLLQKWAQYNPALPTVSSSHIPQSAADAVSIPAPLDGMRVVTQSAVLRCCTCRVDASDLGCSVRYWASGDDSHSCKGITCCRGSHRVCSGGALH